MEGKIVILSVLIIISLVMAQVQVEAKKVCCPNMTARTIFDGCGVLGASQETCATLSGCKLVDDKQCPDGWDNDILHNSGDAVSEYCKMGCAVSVYRAMKTLQNSDESEIVNGAIEKCAMACSAFCTKGSKTDVEKYYVRTQGDAVSEYCKLGCAASKCGAMNTLQNSEDESEIVNGAMEKCAKACSAFCTKGSTTGVETA